LKNLLEEYPGMGLLPGMAVWQGAIMIASWSGNHDVLATLTGFADRFLFRINLAGMISTGSPNFLVPPYNV